MKNLALIFLFSVVTISVYGQELNDVSTEEEPRIHELGIQFYNFDGRYGMNYKFGKSTALWRINAFDLSASTNDRVDHEIDSLTRTRDFYSFGISFGREFRKIINENFEIKSGLDLRYSFRQSNYEDLLYYNNTSQITQRHGLGLGIFAGFNYVAWNRLVIGAEIDMDLSYSFGFDKQKHNGEEERIDNNGYHVGLSNDPIKFSIAYRF